MGLQLIFVVESNRHCKSDWIYIKETINHFYSLDNVSCLLTDEYMDGRGNYNNKKLLGVINSDIHNYRKASKKNESIVIFCFDCDDYDNNPADAVFLNNAKRFCEENRYQFVWFCKDIESVYIGRKVSSSDKRKTANEFKIKRRIQEIDKSRLCESQYRNKYSNLLLVLDNYLVRKIDLGD